MKFKSAEADWNTSFVSQHVEGRNPGSGGGAEVVSTGRDGVGVLDRV